MNSLRAYALPLMAVPSIIVPHAVNRAVPQQDTAEVRVFGSAASDFGAMLDFRIAKVGAMRSTSVEPEYFENVVFTRLPRSARRLAGKVSARVQRELSLAESGNELTRLLDLPRGW